MKTITIGIVAAIAAMFVVAWVESLGVGYHLGFVAVYFGSAIAMFYGIECIVGIIRKRRQRQAERDDIASFRRGLDYRQAAVFVGTACMFIGTQTECDDMCQDLWHWGQQAEVRQLSGEETSFDIL